MKSPRSTTPARPETEPVRARWVDGAADASAEGQAGALFRKAVVDEPLDGARLAAVRTRLFTHERAGRPWALRFAMAFAVLLGFSTLVVAATQVKRWIETRRQAERAAQDERVVSAKRPRAHRRRAPGAAPLGAAAPGDEDDQDGDGVAAAPIAEPPTPAPGAAAAPARDVVGPSSTRPRAHEPPARPASEPQVATTTGTGKPTSLPPGVPPHAATEPPPQPLPPGTLALNTPGGSRGGASPRTDAPPPEATRPPPAAPSPLAEESALLARALRTLRQQNDARGALALFDEHAARFPAGPLTVEEHVGRVEALLQLGRRDEALALLDQMTLPSTGRRRDMLVTRGELRARGGRCAEALIDFGLALTSEVHEDAAAERALYGRASCRARLGDADGARADLEAYLARFPTGRFAPDVRATLKR